MKNLLALLFLAFSFGGASAQSSPGPKQGNLLIETDYSLVSGLLGGTGVGVVGNGDRFAIALGFDGGYFVSDRTALLFRFGLFSPGGANSLVSMSVGGKYYLLDRIPITLDGGVIVGSSSEFSNANTIFTGNINVGYAIPLADNIFLEPNVGFSDVDGDQAITGGFRFAMFLGSNRD